MAPTHNILTAPRGLFQRFSPQVASAVVDHEFGTKAVLIVLPISEIKQHYFEHFDLSRRAA